MTSPADPLTALLRGPGASGYGVSAVMGAVCTVWNPLTRENEVSDGANKYTNLPCLAPSLMTTGRVLLLNTPGLPIIVGPLYTPVVVTGLPGPVLPGPVPPGSGDGGGTPPGGGGTVSDPGFIMFSVDEITNAASTGTAYNDLVAVAAASIGTVDLADQEKDNAATAYAKALLFAKTRDAALKTAVEAALAQLPTASTPPRNEGAETGGVLPVARQLAGWVIAADLVGYRTPAFEAWVSEIRTRFIGGTGNWDVLKVTSQVTANNWGTHSLAGRTACSAYLNDRTDLDQCAAIFRRYTGENRATWGSWVNTNDHDESWVDSQPMAGINGPGAAVSIAGAVVEDIARGPSAPTVDEIGLSYSWEALQGAVVTAKLLTRAGYGDCFAWGSSALLRAARFIHSKTPQFTSFPYGAYPPRHPESQWVPLAINQHYGVSLTGTPVSTPQARGWSIACAHWLFSGGRGADVVDSTTVAAIVTLTQAEYDALGSKDARTLYQIREPSVTADSSANVTSGTIDAVVALTPAAYAALSLKDPRTLYLLTSTGGTTAGSAAITSTTVGLITKLTADQYDALAVKGSRALYCITG